MDYNAGGGRQFIQGVETTEWWGEGVGAEVVGACATATGFAGAAGSAAEVWVSLVLPSLCVPIHLPSEVLTCGSLQCPGVLSRGTFAELGMGRPPRCRLKERDKGESHAAMILTSLSSLFFIHFFPLSPSSILSNISLYCAVSLFSTFPELESPSLHMCGNRVAQILETVSSSDTIVFP